MEKWIGSHLIPWTDLKTSPTTVELVMPAGYQAFALSDAGVGLELHYMCRKDNLQDTSPVPYIFCRSDCYLPGIVQVADCAGSCTALTENDREETWHCFELFE